MSFTPPSTALMVMNCASNAFAIERLTKRVNQLFYADLPRAACYQNVRHGQALPVPRRAAASLRCRIACHQP